MHDLDNATNDALLLLTYAAEKGLPLAPEHAAAIVDARRLVERDQMTTDAEVRFWTGLSALAKLAQPVTIGSLKATLSDPCAPPTRWLASARPRATGAVLHYRRLAYAALACVIVAQTYTLIGERIVADLDTIPGLVDKLNVTLQAKVHQKDRLPARAAAGEDLTLEIAALQISLGEQALRLETTHRLLQQWARAWHPLDAFRDVVPSLAPPVAAALGEISLAPAAPHASAPPNSSTGIAAELQATFVLATLQKYALPLLYGLLGACVFILRNLASEVKALTFESEVTYKLRIPLGGLSGLAIVWFAGAFQPAQSTGGVTPVAMAFLGGYSVEMLFAAMDRFIAGFGSDNRPRAPTPA